MESNSIMDIEQQRKWTVVKSNDLIRRARYTMTLQEQRFILYAISLIKDTDTADTRYEIRISDLCKICGLDLRTGSYRTEFRKIVETLDGVKIRCY